MVDPKFHQLIRHMPPGLDRGILAVLQFHNGKHQAIGREPLVMDLLLAHGFDVHERLVREMIKNLRRQGHLICSAAGEDGGYYMATSWQEYVEFKCHEFLPKIADMSETVSAMDKAANARFGSSHQYSLLDVPA